MVSTFLGINMSLGTNTCLLTKGVAFLGHLTELGGEDFYEVLSSSCTCVWKVKRKPNC